MKSTIFWDITPCSPLSIKRRFGGTYRLHLQDRKNKLSKKPATCFHAGFLLSLFFLMEAICSSETSVNTQRTARRYIPEDGTFHNHRFESFKSYNEGHVRVDHCCTYSPPGHLTVACNGLVGNKLSPLPRLKEPLTTYRSETGIHYGPQLPFVRSFV
jgi:hypothetical protein